MADPTRPATAAPQKAAAIAGVDASSAAKSPAKTLAPGQKAELLHTIFDKTLLPLGNGDPVAIRMQDTTSLFTAAEWPAMWPPPSAVACKRAFTILSSFVLGVPDGKVPGPTIRTAPLTAADELTMLAACLETLTDWNLREWNVIHKPRRPSVSANYGAHVADSKRNNKHLKTDAEHREVADAAVRARRDHLVWAIGAVLWARDLLIHGRAVIFGVGPPPGGKEWWAANGMILFPPAQTLGMKVLDGARETDDRLAFKVCQKVSTALANLGVKVSGAEVQEEFERIWRNPFAAFQVVSIGRMTLLAGLAQNHQAGALGWLAVIDRIAPGAPKELTNLAPDR
ncbi:MAG TPA: hypothetical protein VI796_01860 [Candidatus Thermoplasmatota archaeon]|nr:hypothetical protein [Candidatus Thermoplasmatota archaeon]